MPENPYRVLGADVPDMLGREGLVDRIREHLDREDPRHVSVVGPALYGKSVLLRDIARRYTEAHEDSHTAVYVDLRHGTPRTDDEFRLRIVDELKQVLGEQRPDLVELLEMDEVAAYERIKAIRQELRSAGVSVMVIFDGFDNVLANAGITRAIWDRLRALATRPEIRFVTGSRRPLRELCRTDEARTADFWEIFYDSPVVVGCFEEEDAVALIEPLTSRGTKLPADARETLARWTGGVPALTIALLQSLYEETSADSELSPQQIDETAKKLVEDRRELLSALWEECSAEMKTDLADLTARELKVSEIRERNLRELEQRGFVLRTGKKVRLHCRLIEEFVHGEAVEVGSLQRLFGQDETFEYNVRMLLEMRLAQVPQVDSALHGYVEQTIRHLDPEPRHAIVWVRSIVDRAMDLIWEKELGSGMAYPATWTAEWERQGLTRVPDDGHGRLPSERGLQSKVLRFATGTGVKGRSVRRVTKHFTRPTALLIEHLLSVGNFGQHQVDEVTRPFAVSVCLSAITLCASMARDLGIESPEPTAS